MSGKWVGLAHRAAVAPVAMEVPAMTGGVFLLPPQVNWHGEDRAADGAIEQRPRPVEVRLDRLCRGSGSA